MEAVEESLERVVDGHDVERQGPVEDEDVHESREQALVLERASLKEDLGQGPGRSLRDRVAPGLGPPGPDDPEAADERRQERPGRGQDDEREEDLFQGRQHGASSIRTGRRSPRRACGSFVSLPRAVVSRSAHRLPPRESSSQEATFRRMMSSPEKAWPREKAAAVWKTDLEMRAQAFVGPQAGPEPVFLAEAFTGQVQADPLVRVVEEPGERLDEEMAPFEGDPDPDVVAVRVVGLSPKDALMFGIVVAVVPDDEGEVRKQGLAEVEVPVELRPLPAVVVGDQLGHEGRRRRDGEIILEPHVPPVDRDR